MPWTGTGTFTLNQDFPSDSAAGSPDSVISSSKVDNELENIKAGLENCFTLNSETAPTVNLDMNAKRIVNVGSGVLANDAVTVTQVNSGAVDYVGTFGGTANAITATLSAAPTAPAAGFRIRGVVGTTNTGAATVAINAIAAKPIKRVDGSALQAGDLIAGRPITLTYMGAGTDQYRVTGGGLPNDGFGANVFYLSTIAGSDTLTGTPASADFNAYNTGDVFVWKQPTTNTGAVTLNVNSVGAKTVKDFAGLVLTADALVAGRIYTGMYDGTDVLIGQHLPLTGNTLDSLSDTGISSQATGEALVWSGSAWVNSKIATAGLDDAAVTTTKIADANVTTAKIADANVTTAKIADANVTTAKIANANVTTAKLADSAVTTAKIADAAVTDAKIAAVSGAKVSAGTLPASAFNAAVPISSGGTASTTAAAARTALGLGIGADIPALAHAHAISDVTSLQSTLDVKYPSNVSLSNGTDPDTLTTDGVYSVFNPVGLTASTTHVIEVHSHAAGWTIQRAHVLDPTEATFMRFQRGGGWSAWNRILEAAGGITLTGGFATTPHDYGTISSGTHTPSITNSNFAYYTNNGAHTFAAPPDGSQFVYRITNGASAGAITTSAYTNVVGNAFTTVNGDVFIVRVEKIGATVRLDVEAI